MEARELPVEVGMPSGERREGETWWSPCQSGQRLGRTRVLKRPVCLCTDVPASTCQRDFVSVLFGVDQCSL